MRKGNRIVIQTADGHLTYCITEAIEQSKGNYTLVGLKRELKIHIENNRPIILAYQSYNKRKEVYTTVFKTKPFTADNEPKHRRLMIWKR